MLVLGIETSGAEGSVALCRDGGCVEQRLLKRTGPRHAQSLVQQVREMLDSAGVAPHDVNRVAVSIGPGSFTGLRIGVVFAKTFAYATGCEVAVVETFQCVAENCPADVDRCHVIGNAQRGELFVGEYRRGLGAAWTPAGSIAIVKADDWCRRLSPDDVVTGPGIVDFEEKLAGCHMLDSGLCHPRAMVVAQLGANVAEPLTGPAAWSLVPRYLRKSAADEARDARDPRPR